MDISVKKIINFINNDIWSFRINSVSRRKSLIIATIRVIVLSVKNFFYDQCYLRASAITFYSMLSVVPVLALLIGIAKGFGYKDVLQNYLINNFAENKEVIEKIFTFAESMLENSKGGVVAGIGVLLLLWAAIKLVGNIESSFNYIWRVPHNRPFLHKVSYYLVLLFIAPFMIVVSISANVFITTQMNQWISKVTMIQELASPVVAISIQLLPYILIWLLFTFLYKMLPNTKVSIFSALVGGIIAGTMFQFLQEFYIIIQVAMFAKYKAIYGSFSTLPLFLLWLQFTWLIVLFGAEIVFAHQNSSNFELEIFTDKISRRAFKSYAVRTISMLVKNFINHGMPMDINAISMKAHMSIGLTKQVITTLIEAEILFEAIDKKSGMTVYQPACNSADLTVWEVISRLENIGMERFISSDSGFENVTVIIAAIDDQGRNAAENVKIRDLQLT